MKINGIVSNNNNITKWGEIQGEIKDQQDLVDLYNSKDEYYSNLIRTESDARIGGDVNLDNKLNLEIDARIEQKDDLIKYTDLITNNISSKLNQEISDRKDSDNLIWGIIGDKADIAYNKSFEVEKNLQGHLDNSIIHVTQSDKDNWNSKTSFSGDYNDLKNKPEIPSKVSHLINDEKFQTESEVDIKLVTKADINVVNSHITDTSIHVKQEDKNNWNAKLSEEKASKLYKKVQNIYDSNSECSIGTTDEFISRVYQDSEGKIFVEKKKPAAANYDYKELYNKPLINGIELNGNLSTSEIGIILPTKLSQLENDSEANYIKKDVSDLVNYYDKVTNETLVKNIAYTKSEIDNFLSNKQDNLVAEDGIIVNNSNIKVSYDNDTIKLNSANQLYANEKVKDVKVDGTSIVINNVAEIDLTGKQNKLKAGANINIDPITNEISASGSLTTVNWGGIVGDINNQTDLNNRFNQYIKTTNVSTVGQTGEYSDIKNKPTIPTKTSQLTNDSGFITSTSGTIVSDIKINNTSIVDTTGVANLTVPTNSTPGLLPLNGHNGVAISTGGSISTLSASSAEIDGKSNQYNQITPSNLDYAVMKGLTNPLKHTWTDNQRELARTTINAAKNVLATNTSEGLVIVGNGLDVNSGVISVISSSEGDIASRLANTFISANTLDIAVREGLAKSSVVYSETEKSQARNLLNAAENKVATASTPGLAYANSNNGIYMSTGGQMMLDQATIADIESREDVVVHAITAGNYDYAVKEALCNSEGLALSWTAGELLQAQHKLGIDNKQDNIIEGNGISLNDYNILSTRIDGVTIKFNSDGEMYALGGGGSEGPTDVRINNTSITSGGIANIPIGKGKLGVGQFDNSTGGLQIGDSGTVSLYPASTDNMAARQYDRAITSKTFDDAVKTHLTDGIATAYTTTEKTAARTRLDAQQTLVAGTNISIVDNMISAVTGEMTPRTNDSGISSSLWYIGTKDGGQDVYCDTGTNPIKNPTILGNCTWYAFGRSQEIVGKSFYDQTRSGGQYYGNLITGGVGNAKAWFNMSLWAHEGYADASTGDPVAHAGEALNIKAGDILCWYANDGGAGHVEIVERIDSDGYLISYSGYNSNFFSTYHTKDYPEMTMKVNGYRYDSTKKWRLQGVIHNPYIKTSSAKVQDVKVNGTSVVNSEGVANISTPSYSAGDNINIAGGVISATGVAKSATGVTILKISQADYDALVVKDSNTIYLIY